ncbi:hypothetical protein B0T25DRAFT_514492 [Lasiosphaeria hispida]|uniref:Ubiquitin 3 binding protein But2 C-terminal domain-containing protein n=1 Tax=Lasiosphaeria hispida TaxID=260671 RepID=A0AAJ0HP22_9PEZI|nr:hypothetical protein B0T25DRAFT_514492 [Lasiosphaeria hispida]
MLPKTLLLPLLLTATTAALPHHGHDSDPAQQPLPPGPSTTTTTGTTTELQPATAVLHDGFWGPPGNICSAKTLQIFKSTTSSHPLSTMLKFQYPSAKYCWLDFEAPAVPAGTGREVDVFLQWAPVDTCPSEGNRRDAQVGRLEIPAGGGRAVWRAVYKEYLTSSRFPCPAAGKVEGIELVGVGDNEDIRWTQGKGKGVRILYGN